ncbi:hypothetical protein HNY42_01120 [Exiguobacterium sp. Helios]|uniref:hypothetical protein n=1 Tax=unclassified Exiguobacterium TaxID=2644629 RepID=UPI00165E4F5E|nr:hypothetical protein [Exiguobacterium sp. Helios]QNR19643.1 hypothetical protein HNY42_01120 [Exiguobacterium sp. Helios]
MIYEFIQASESTTIGGFIATCADPILAHVNPAQLKTKDLIVSIHKDHSIFAARIPLAENELNWIELSPENIKKQTSLLAPNTCYFGIKRGELHGTYLVSNDLIANKYFSNERDYLDGIVLSK